MASLDTFQQQPSILSEMQPLFSQNASQILP